MVIGFYQGRTRDVGAETLFNRYVHIKTKTRDRIQGDQKDETKRKSSKKRPTRTGRLKDVSEVRG